MWSNYKMCVATFYDEGDADPAARYPDAPSLASALAALGSRQGAPTWCSNPYIEHGRGNASTNCIGCHQHGGTGETVDSVLGAPDRFPDFGRTKVRESFPADYTFTTDGVLDLAAEMRARVEALTPP